MQTAIKFKLSKLRPGESASVESVSIDDNRLTQRLADLGLRAGQTIACLNNSPTGGVSSYKLSHGIFALEDSITNKITVLKGDK